MKFTFFIIAFLFIGNLVAQEKIWVDQKGNTTNKESALYYREFSKIRKEKKQVIDYYKSGKIAKKYFLKNGILEGKYIEYYFSGEVKIIGNYFAGYKEGVWKTYYKNGKIKEKGKYQKDKKVDVWKTYYKNSL